ncbi:MAG: hypothetical protein RBS99_17415 [Rhodospirillales bacterium]|nr:hypothetical protein [Rhodospirillales bacterium]
MALLIAVMAAALPFADQLISRFQMARDHYVATTICQGRIERARAVPYSDLPLLAEDKQLVDDFGAPASPGGRFRRTTTVLSDDPDTGLTTLLVDTEICSCSKLGWRTRLHPIRSGKNPCAFAGAHETMRFLFTELAGD